MKNLTIKEITKKGMAIALAVVMELTGAALNTKGASAETYTYGGHTLVQQEVEANPMTIEEYALECDEDAAYLGGVAEKNAKNANPDGGFVPYDHLYSDNQCLEFLINITLIPQEVKDELVAKGIVFKVDFETYQGMELFGYAYNLINLISKYNQAAIKEGHSRELIDASKLCYDEHDASLLKTIHDTYFNAYVTGMEGEKGTLILNEHYNNLFQMLLDLNYGVENGNLRGATVGGRWFGLNIYGNGIRQLIYDYIQSHYTPNEIYQYFVQEKWNAGQMEVRKDIVLDTNCLKNELEVLAFQVGQIDVWIYDTINNDIFKEVENFGRGCATK